MTDRDRLIELYENSLPKNNGVYLKKDIEEAVDYLLANGVIVTPCVAMVEQFLKDGKLDKRNVTHNGKYAVVYIDKSKWNCPLIDITEQYYNNEKAKERIQALKECL